MKQSARIVGVVLSVLFVARDAGANDVRQYSLEKKARLSDVVVAGHVLSTRTEPPIGGGETYARVRVDAILKGTPGENVEVLTRGMISEFDPDCCVIGKSYLFFLVKLRKGGFESVNGPYGIYPLETR